MKKKQEYILECWRKYCDEYGKVFRNIQDLHTWANKYGSVYTIENYCAAKNGGQIANCAVVNLILEEEL